MTCPPCNHNCNQGRECPVRGEFSEYGRECNRFAFLAFWIVFITIEISGWFYLIKWFVS